MTDPKHLFDQNIQMWEKMTTAYMDSMFKAMQKSVDQTTAFRKQIDESVNAAVSAQLADSLSAIQSLERQVAMLSQKVDQLIRE
jgi:ubiquinone biosynthesis protein UbiJ